jgi:hypothetical protein
MYGNKSEFKNFTEFYKDLEADKLPQWMWITNMTNDGHGTNVTVARAWAKSFLTPLLSNKKFLKNTLVLLTFDENETYNISNKAWAVLLDTRAILVFQRLQRFYQTFDVLAALIGGLSLATLIFNEFHPCTTSASCSAEAFLCSSAMTAVISAMLATMLLFCFEGHDAPTRKELGIAWSPLVLLDWAIIEFLVGLMLRYANKSDSWRSSLVAAGLSVLLALTTYIALWMWRDMSVQGDLGAEEREKAAATARTADH